MSKEGWIHMELPYHQNEMIKLIKRRLRKRNMAEVVEILLQEYDQELLDTSIKAAKLVGLYQPIGDENGNDDE